jgi:GT2 family glycosyltransferase
MPDHSVSIVVINKDDPRVRDTLEALGGLPEVTDGLVEVVVVDASTDRPPDRSGLHWATWVDFEPIPGTTTIPHQRNAGVRQACGSLIVFLDASCIPHDDWLSAVLAPIREAGEQIVAGAHLSGESAFRDHNTTRLESQRYLPEAPTLNLAVATRVFDQIGTFDESFAYGSDVDLCWRAVDAGFRIAYAPGAVVSHDWGSAGADARRSFRYGKARARLYLKHPHRWRQLFGRDAQTLAYPLFMLAVPWSVRRPVLWLALLLPLYRNRGAAPIRTIVDHFIYGAGVLDELRELAVRR